MKISPQRKFLRLRYTVLQYKFKAYNQILVTLLLGHSMCTYTSVHTCTCTCICSVSISHMHASCWTPTVRCKAMILYITYAYSVHETIDILCIVLGKSISLGQHECFWLCWKIARRNADTLCMACLWSTWAQWSGVFHCQVLCKSKLHL